MATYVNNLRLKEITTGDEDGTWGTSTNTNLELITDGFSYGTKEMAGDANETFTMPDATADATRSLYLKFTSAASLTATREITLGPNTVSKTWIIENATTGGQIITIKQGSGATVNVANGSKVMVVTDGAGAGAAVLNANPSADAAGTLPISGGGTGATDAANALINFGLTATAAELNTLDGITATTTELNYNDITTLGTTEASKTVTADANGVVTFDNGISEEYTAVTSSANATTCNMQDGTNFSHTLTENTTFTFSNPAASGKVSSFTLKIVQDASASGYTVTWPAAVDWPAATAPTLTADANAVDYFVFITNDGGTTWYGFTAGQAMG